MRALLFAVALVFCLSGPSSAYQMQTEKGQVVCETLRAFEELTIAVDTHVFRVSNRTRLAPGKDPLAVELNLLKVTPKKYLRNAHHYLILHGRYTCIAQKPLCWKCPVYEQCEFPERRKFAKLDPALAKPKKVLPKGR